MIERQETAMSLMVKPVLHRIRFVAATAPGQRVLLAFTHPIPTIAILESTQTFDGGSEDSSETIAVVVLAQPPSEPTDFLTDATRWIARPLPSGSAPPSTLTIHGAEIVLGGSRAAILAAPDRAEPLRLALVEFLYYDRELERLEHEVADAWPELESDRALAFRVRPIDQERFEDVGLRMERALERRTRLARIAPRLFHPRPDLPPLGKLLVERLIERMRTESRHDALVSQLDVFDRIYEMTSQRISDFSEARKSHTLEWVIIVLLAAEVVLLLADLLWKAGV